MAEIRMYIGNEPPEPAQANMVWTELQPGSGRWIELPESFVTVGPKQSTAPTPATERPSDWMLVLRQAQAARGKMPLWVWPGIPIALGGFKIARWFFRRRKAKA